MKEEEGTIGVKIFMLPKINSLELMDKHPW